MPTKHSSTRKIGPDAAVPWDLVRTFLALERHRDYAVAAEMEGIDHTTLRRRIQALEQQLGRTVFIRTQRGWEVSADLQKLVDAAQDMAEAAKRFSLAVQDDAGVIRISLLDAFAHRFANAFTNFRERHPRLVLNITTETHFVDLKQDQVDIAIRLARPVQGNSSLKIKKIGDVPINVYASKSYLQSMGGAHANRTAQHHFLGMNLGFSHSDHTFTYGSLDRTEFGLSGKVVAWSDSFSMLARLCENGLGVAIMPTVMAVDYPGLQKVDPAQADVTTELWMISRFDLRAPWQLDLANLLQQELNRWMQPFAPR